MGLINVVATAFGVSDTIINNEGGQLNDTNTALQLGAVGLGYTSIYKDTLNPVVAGTAIGAAGAALVTQLAVIQSDIANNKSNTDVMADILTAVGDIGIAAGITLSANPETKLLGAGILSASDGITLTGVGIKNWDSVKTNTPIAYNELIAEVDQQIAGEQSAMTQAANIFVNSGAAGASVALANAWNSTETALSNAMNAVSNAVNNLGNSNFNASATSATSSLTNSEVSLTNLFNSTGANPQNITETVTNNGFTITSGNNTVASGNVTFGANDSSTGISTGNNSETIGVSSVSITDTKSSYDANNIIQSSQSVTTQSNGQTSSDAKLYNNGTLTQEDIVNQNGNFNIVKYASDGVTQAISDLYDATGKVVKEVMNANITWAQFDNVAASALATQVIAQFLFKNNLPASAAAQAFSNVTVQVKYTANDNYLQQVFVRKKPPLPRP